MDSKFRLVNNTGLHSEKNICFVNTALQLFHNIPTIREYFIQKNYQSSVRPSSNMPICNEISNLFNATYLTHTSAAKLRALVSQASKKVYLNNGSHQDAVEFFSIMVESIENELHLEESLNKSIIQKFRGMEKVEKGFENVPNGQCQKCFKKPRDETEEFLVLPLVVNQSANSLSINDLLKKHFSSEKGYASMKCDCCNHIKDCTLQGNCKPKSISMTRSLIEILKFY